jgi:hypothetical protein
LIVVDYARRQRDLRKYAFVYFYEYFIVYALRVRVLDAGNKNLAAAGLIFDVGYANHAGGRRYIIAFSKRIGLYVI